MNTEKPIPTVNSSPSHYGDLPIPKPIQENNQLKAIFEELVRAGVDQTELSASFCLLDIFAKSKRRGARSKSTPWPDIAVTKRQVQGLPRRIRTMAKEIERLNAASLFDPGRWVPSSNSPDNEAVLRFLAGMHTRLPGFLDTYAAYLDGRLAELGQFGRKKFSLSKAIRIKLSDTVHRATGNYHDEKLADLIAAVTGEVLTGDDLKKLRQRNPKFRKKTP
jgi:hypothetical protein